jgi:hypothetical protein
LRDGALWRGAAIAGLAGLLTGSAVGLKLPEAPFALGFAAALAILPGDWRHRCTRLLAAGSAVSWAWRFFAGYWFVKMAASDGQSALSLFQRIFPFAAGAHRVLSRHALHPDRSQALQLLFPLLFSIDWRVADDLPFQDIRVGLAYVLVILTLPLWFFARKKRADDRRAGRGGAVRVRRRRLYRVAQDLRHLPLHPLLEMMRRL